MLVYANEDGGETVSSTSGEVEAISITLTGPTCSWRLPVPRPPRARLNPDGQVNVSWSVLNSGTDAANGPWQDYVYWSAKSTFDSSATQLQPWWGSGWSPPALPLAAGGSYNQSGTVSIPTTTPGTYYLFVVADADQGQYEASTANNVSAAIPVTVALPELNVTAATAPGAAVLGSSIQVSWTVENTGAAVTSGQSWEDAVYVSSSTTLDNTATRITDFWENRSPLANGPSYTETENITLPATAVGNRYLLFVADDDNSLTQNGAASNVYAVPIRSRPPRPWRPTAATAPAEAVVGQTIPISWTVTNQGPVAAPAQWSDAVYVSPDDTFDAAAKVIATYHAPAPPLAVGELYADENVVLPLSYAGPRYLIFVANSGYASRKATRPAIRITWTSAHRRERREARPRSSPRRPGRRRADGDGELDGEETLAAPARPTRRGATGFISPRPTLWAASATLLKTCRRVV